MNKKLQVLKYVIADILSALLAWNLFFFYRKISINHQAFHLKEQILIDNNLLLGIILIPIFWFILYLLIGTYSKIYRKSRLKELGQTLLISIIGVIVLFFVVLIDKDAKTYKDYYFSFFILFLLHFGITFAFRLILTSITAYRIHHRIIGFNTVIVGSDKNAITLYNDIESQTKSAGNKFIGFVHVKNNGDYHLGEYLPHLGHYKNILNIIHSNKVEEVIIAIEPSEHKTIDKILTEINGANVVIKVIPDMQDILLGSVKMTAIWDAPLIQISPELMPVWQQSIKRVMDIAVSLIVLIGFSPIYLIIGVLVKMTSEGPVFYSHDRVGLHGKTFKMHKFRSMFINAEINGPQLSSKNDPRITPFGRFMRKVRLDEIPQFYNVLKGDMALVGYRPERQFFIEQITKTAPHYRLLFKVKPGITSWGQVKYGYAENVEQMINRLKYDILYLENMSISVDLKILIYTVLIIIQGRGK
ncbi:MAG: sugar transferase [Bacteroidales bacterium]|jgi:exopolysaccharide biosynthesis polyprenyl glycosylphosphotransferase